MISVVAILGLGYVGIVAFLFFAQTGMVFPGARMASHPVDSPRAPERLTLARDGATLHGMLFRGAGQDADLMIGFGGNAQDAEFFGQGLASDFPDLDVVVFHYRGYGPSTGKPSEAAVLADALLIHDTLIERLKPGRVFAIGISLGSSVAAYLSSQRALAGLLLVTPFDSIEAIAKETYFWLPVGLLLQHRFATVRSMAGNATPVAVIAAADDRVVSPRRTRALVERLENLVFDRTLADANHTSLYELPSYAEALRAALAAVRDAR